MTDTKIFAQDQKQARRASLGAFMGAVVDWYDFILYGLAAALVFNTQFFPNISPEAGAMAAFATYGVGFFFRPLGGIVFGHFGDKLGRKKMLVLTMIIMGAATTLIGFLPSYEQVGVFAPLLLVFLRAIQGFAVGGEWGGAALMSVESAPSNRRALYGSGVQVGYQVGLILATAFIAVMGFVAGPEGFAEWGWRVPFISSVILVGAGLIVRARVTETSEFVHEVEEKGAKAKAPLIAAFQENPKAFLQIFGLRLVELFTSYIVTTFALSYSTNTLHMDKGFMLEIGLIVGVVGIFTIPTFAILSDRFGRRKIYILSGLIGALSAAPFFISLEAQYFPGVVVFAILLVNVAHDLAVSVQQPLFADMFATRNRYSGAGVAYQLTSAIAGGLTPFIAAVLVATSGGSWTLVVVYMVAGCLVSSAVAFFLKLRQPNTTDPKATAGLQKQSW
jgi:MFS transporter, MHS family, shikimate and dehydroshikimate transport protein